jgi:hypothetical protein
LAGTVQYHVYSNANGVTHGSLGWGFPFWSIIFPEWIGHGSFLLKTLDDEYVALDIAFPHNGHDAALPMIYFLLHGLNIGGSDKEYI